MFQTKFVEKIKTHNLCSVTSPPLPRNRTVCKIMWKNIVERGRLQMTIWRMRVAFKVTKATNTHSEYVILHCFSTTPTVARTHLRATLYAHCLSCFGSTSSSVQRHILPLRPPPISHPPAASDKSQHHRHCAVTIMFPFILLP